MSAEPDDLLGKADALMARGHPGRPAATAYPDIPILDEVVETPLASGDVPVLTESVVALPMNEEQVEALAANIRASLLANLQPRIDALIHERLKARMAPMVQKMFEDLRANMQAAAGEVLGDAIRSAVKQELERRKPDR